MVNFGTIATRLLIALSMLLACPTPQSKAAGALECPEVGAGHVPDLMGDAAGGGLYTTTSRVDLVNQINGAINRLQDSKPDISWSDTQDVLISAYCRVVAAAPGLTSSEKWKRMRTFATIVEQQVAGDAMPAGSLIIASVPLPPVVFRTLGSQAAAVHLTPSQFMADILTQAAGR
jgi:hypothetical protein